MDMVFIITGGQISDLTFLQEKLSLRNEKTTIICADGGARHLCALGIIPDVIIGDLDSLPLEMERGFAEGGSRIIRHAAAKDETDTELALHHAFSLNPDAVWIFGALGHRIDHTLANISLLASAAQKGIAVTLMDEWCEVFLVHGETMIDGKAGQTVSLLPLTTRVTGITLEGFEYPLKDSTMEIGKPFGISNRLATTRGRITVSSGYLLAVRFFKAGAFPEEEP